MKSWWTCAQRAFAVGVLFGLCGSLSASDDFGLKQGAIALKSAGPLAFGPPGILLVADPLDASVYAIDTGERKGEPASVKINVENLGAKLGGMLGVEAEQVNIVDVAVNPASGTAYLSVGRGRCPDAPAGPGG